MALGVGGILAPATASADEAPSRPSHGAHATDRGVAPRAATDRTSPQRPTAAAASRAPRSQAGSTARGASMASAPNPFVTRPVRRADPTAPVALPMAWASAAVTRREYSGAARVAAPAAATVVASAVATPDPVAAAPAVNAAISVASILDPLISAAAEYFVRQYFPDSRWAPLVGHVAPIVVDGLADWIFNGTVSPEVDRLASDPVVLQAISDIVAIPFAGTGVSAEAGRAVGNAAATWVNLAFSGTQGEPLRGYFDTLLNSLPGLPSGWDTARLLFELAVGTYTFDQLIDDQLGTPLQTGISTFLATPGVQLALSNATAGAVSVLLGNTGPSWDPSATRSVGVPALVGEGVGQAVAVALLGDQPDAANLRSTVGDIVTRLMNNPALGDAAARTVETTLATLLAQPEIRDAVAISAANAVRAFFAVPQVPVPTLQNAIGTTVTNSVGALLTDTRVIAAVGRTLRDVLTGLTSNSAVQNLIGRGLTASLGDGVGQAVVEFLATPGFSDSLATALGTIPTNLLGPQEVRVAVAAALGRLARDLTAGVPFSDAIAPVLTSLRDDPAVPNAIGTTVSGSVSALLADTQVIAGAGRAFRDVFAGLTSDPAVRALIGEVFAVPLGNAAGQAVVNLLATTGFRDGLAQALGNIPMNLLGPEDVRTAFAAAFGQLARDVTAGVPLGDATGPVLTALLDNPTVRRAFGSTATLLAIDVINNLATFADVAVEEPTSRALATYVGTAVTGFLNYPGITTVLTDTVDVVVTNAVNGTDPGSALYDLQTNPTYRAALGATIPNLVGSVFGDSALRRSIGQLASVGVVELMRGAGVDVPILNVAVGQAAYAAVTSLLADTQVAQLVSTLAIGALSATPNGVLVDTALHAVLTEFGLQAAIGFALGRGVGALFGDNVFATAFGEVTGAAATLVIAAVAGITRLFVGDFAPPAAASIDTGRFFITLPVAANA